jgi:hypothetical protein
VTDPLQIHVRKVLAAAAAATAAIAAAAAQIEADGGRIVTGRQISVDMWEITDWRTGERIASGPGWVHDREAAVERLEPAGTWWDIEEIQEIIGQSSYEVTETDGLPESLAEIVEEWASTASREDLAAVAGMTVEDVTRCFDGGDPAQPSE